MTRFANKSVIVTGAGSGIGEAAARRFSQEGAQVTLVGRSADKLEDLAKSLAADRTLVHAADVSSLDEVETLVQAVVDRFGGIDVVVNAAGTFAGSYLDESSVDDWRKVMANDLDSVFFMCRTALPHLRKRRGNIVNVSSVSGLGGDWGMSYYNAAKGAVTNFTRSIAMELGADGVRVNAVCPSLTESEMTQDILDNEELLAKFRERMPLGAPAKASDIAGPIVFLASEDAGFVTGVNLPVDGGLSASNGQPPQQ